jgi:hypothetical protein
MKFSKTLMSITAAGALCAAATPALAFDNEIHGSYLMKYFVTNYEAVGNRYIFSDLTKTDGTNDFTNSRSRKTSNYFDTRTRFYYSAKASDDLKLVTAFEIDAVFGDRAQQNGRNGGAALEADSVNLETKWVYLDFKIPSTPVKITAGIQPIKDKFKGIFFDADVAGINSVTTMGPATVGLGYFRAYDSDLFTTGNQNDTPRGVDNLDIVAASVDYNVNKNLRVGGAYYLYNDDRSANTLTVHCFGANFDAKINKLALSGFAAMQHGEVKNDNTTINAMAFNLAAKHPVGPGTLKVAALYTTGDDGDNSTNTAWQAVNQSPGGANNGTNGNVNMTNSYNESGMMLLNRNTSTGGTTTDYHLVQGAGNLDQGVILATIGYDATINPKWYAKTNVGAAWVSSNNSQMTNLKTHGNNFIGTEFNVETGYKLYDNLTASVQGAYVILGGYYSDMDNGRDPANPFTARLALNYAF